MRGNNRAAPRSVGKHVLMIIPSVEDKNASETVWGAQGTNEGRGLPALLVLRHDAV